MNVANDFCSLNKLKVANRIHILEPQWNPSVESQAIGRILRLGQEKSVTITRYIMNGTVEGVSRTRNMDSPFNDHDA